MPEGELDDTQCIPDVVHHLVRKRLCMALYRKRYGPPGMSSDQRPACSAVDRRRGACAEPTPRSRKACSLSPLSGGGKESGSDPEAVTALGAGDLLPAVDDDGARHVSSSRHRETRQVHHAALCRERGAGDSFAGEADVLALAQRREA